MFAASLLVIWSWSTCVSGTDYLVSVHSPSSIDVTTDGTGGSVRVSYPNYDVHQGYGVPSKREGIKLEKRIGTLVGYDNSSALVSCSHRAMTVTVNSISNDVFFRNRYKYNVFSPLPVSSLGTTYLVSSCIQNNTEYSVLVITAYKLKAQVSVIFDTNVEFLYYGQRYGKGDTFSISLKAYQTFTFRVRYDLSGTRIVSTESIAVFSGTANSTSVYTYTQLLPVEMFSDEFVVAVDDSQPPFQLQIIGEQNDFILAFNNGTSTSTASNILTRLLNKNETFQFVANKPVMVTLCRSNGDWKGFALFPPVSSYRERKTVTLVDTTLVVTLFTAVIDVSGPFVSGEWEPISQSRYKLGRFLNKYELEETGQSPFPSIAIVITFTEQTFYIDGLSFAEEDQPVLADAMESFIVVAPSSRGPHLVAVGETESFYQVWCSDSVIIRETFPYVEDYFDLPSKSPVCTVETDSEDLHVFLQDTDVNEALSVPILPVSSLGKKYVIPRYDASVVNNRHIMMATGNWTASIDVTKKDGTVALYDLREYQTVTVYNEPSGMGVSASRAIAVFTEHHYGDFHGRHTYIPQLLPNEAFGNEYVLAVGSFKIDFFFADNVTEEYYVNITSLHDNTSIIFNDGATERIDEGKFYHKDVSINGSLHFTSSNPVMTYLCLKAEVQDGSRRFNESTCTILPPVEQFVDSAVFNIPENANLKIITRNDNNDFHAFTVNYRLLKTTKILKWVSIPKTDYKVGTTTAGTGPVFMESTHKFLTIVYGYDCCSIPVFNVLFSISTSSLSVQQRTQKLSTNAEGTSTSTTGHLQEFPSTPEGSSYTTFPDQDLSNDGNKEENDYIALIVGCVCGFIILVLACIVGFLFYRMAFSKIYCQSHIS